MTRINRALLGVLGMATAGAIAAGCAPGVSSEPGATIPPPESAAVAEQTAPATPLSPRGMLPLELGEVATMHDVYSTTGAELLRFSVNTITPNAECPDGVDPYMPEMYTPENGQFLVLDVTMETTADYTPASGASFSEYQFTIQGPDGYTHTSLATTPSYACTPDEMRPPTSLVPSSRYQVMVVLDVPVTEGILMYRTMAGEGWEWKLGQ